MNSQDFIMEFFKRTLKDPRINKGHITLFVALVYAWGKQDHVGPISIYSWEIMPLAKISSTPTYHTLIRELAAFGYIRYMPSFYKKRASQIFIN